MNDIIVAIAIGIVINFLFGQKIHQWLAYAETKELKLTFLMVFVLCFVGLFGVALSFLLVVYILKGFAIPWAGLFITTILMSFFIALIVWLKDKFYHGNRNKLNIKHNNKYDGFY